MARTIEIPRENWSNYLNNLNHRTGGHPVRIEVENMELGDQEMARMLPLQEVTFEKKGSFGGSIEIRVGRDDVNNPGELTHWVKDASRLYVQQDDKGEPLCIEIETPDGGKTFIWSEHLPSLAERGAGEAPHMGAP